MPLEPLPKELQAKAIDNALESSAPISILGYGVTTKPIVAFLNALGKACAIYDDKPEGKRLDSSSGGDVENILLDSREFCAEFSALEILSPGIPPDHAYFGRARRAVSEYDFIWWLENSVLGSQGRTLGVRNCSEREAITDLSLQTQSTNQKPMTQIWVSGTNGKTTTTQMLTHILAPFGARSGGNIGTPLITLYEQNTSLWVLETSSFALHYTKVATPRIYALLPLSQDHISWHNGFAGYVDDKLSPLARMGVDSVAIVPSTLRDHRLCKEFAGEMVFYRDSSDLRAFLRAKGLELDKDSLPFFEPFLLDASIALASAVALASLCPRALTQAHLATFIPALAGFTVGAHRMEEFFVQDLGAQWLFIDDSKGTNTDATLQAITRYKDRALFLILGGDDKGADCTEIFTLLQRMQKAQIFTIGSNESKLLSLAREYGVRANACGSLHRAMEAIYKARDIALHTLESKGKERTESSAIFAKDFACLLSPAAASLDQFSSYKERGELFKTLAQSLANHT